MGEGITFSNLKATLSDLARRLFGQNVRTRFRASFPFTEPSAEFDVECFSCGGKGCPVCGGGWLEIGGCGMVNPNVLRNGGYDPERYTGFALRPRSAAYRDASLRHQRHPLLLGKTTCGFWSSSKFVDRNAGFVIRNS